MEKSKKTIDTTSINEKIYQILKDRIINREYQPGHKVNIGDLQNEFGVSNSPIKDSLFRLAGEEFVEIIPRKGTFVIVQDITTEDIIDVEQIRIIIESAVIELVAQQITDEEIELLESLYQNTLMKQKKADYITYLQKDFKFHEEIIRLSNNKKLCQIYRQLNTHISIFRFQYAHNINNKLHTLHPLTNQDHLEILNALRDRDPIRAKKAIINHRINAKKITFGEVKMDRGSNLRD